MKYAYYPGCSLESTAWDYDISTRAVCSALGIELEEIRDWTCCGSSPAHQSSRSLGVALPALNLQKAAEMGCSIMNIPEFNEGINDYNKWTISSSHQLVN